jgi:hypothetical protein
VVAEQAAVSLSLSGDAGCLGCLAIVGIPALLIWQAKRRLFGRGQPPLTDVWKAGTVDPAVQAGLERVGAADAAFSLQAFEALVIRTFETLTHVEGGEAVRVAEPAVLKQIRRRPRHAIVQSGRVISVEAGAEQRIALVLSGIRGYGPIGWSRWEEQWTFGRATPAGQGSRGAPVLCPVCGAPLAVTAEGTCSHCGAPDPMSDTWRLTERAVLGGSLFG